MLLRNLNKNMDFAEKRLSLARIFYFSHGQLYPSASIVGNLAHLSLLFKKYQEQNHSECGIPQCYNSITFACCTTSTFATIETILSFKYTVIPDITKILNANY